jgi:threonine dehydratase
MYAHLASGSTKPMPIAPTLADGVAGNIERDSITWRMCRQLVDEVVLIDEEQIADAMRWAIDAQHLLIEPSAALAIAVLLNGLGGLERRRVAAVLTGRNVDVGTVASVLGG